MCRAQADSRLLCENVPVTDVLASLGIVARGLAALSDSFGRKIWGRKMRGCGCAAWRQTAGCYATMFLRSVFLPILIRYWRFSG